MIFYIFSEPTAKDASEAPFVEFVVDFQILIHLNQVLKYVAFCLDQFTDREEFVSKIKGDQRVQILNID